MNLNINNPDFKEVVIHKKQPTSSQIRNDPKLLQSALRNGSAVAVTKDTKNKSNDIPVNVRKLEDNEKEDFRHEHVSSSLKQNIIKARTDKKMTQSQLAQSINERPQVIQEYENGKAIPNPQVLSKLSRVLGVHLRR